MSTIRKTIQGLLGLAFLSAGGQKLAGTDTTVDEFARYRYPMWLRVTTGAVEVGGAVGMLVGLVRPAVVRLAGPPLAATMVGALATHRRVGDPATAMVPAAVLLALTIAAMAPRLRRSSGPPR